jgi:uncharacterized protein YjbI with pentapeptide repeats
VTLARADLRKAYLGGDFTKADLSGADLREARLDGWFPHLNGNVGLFIPSARAALLKPANLSDARMAKADLRKASLLGAQLVHADLKGAQLQQADLRGADLQGADLADADLTGATYDRQTRWPAGFDPAAHGAHLED